MADKKESTSKKAMDLKAGGHKANEKLDKEHPGRSHEGGKKDDGGLAEKHKGEMEKLRAKHKREKMRHKKAGKK